MDRMMRGIFLLAALLVAGPALADSVVPRLGPLPVLAEDGSVSGEADIPFGQPLSILSQDGAVLTVQDDAGQELRVRATDVIAAPQTGLTLMPTGQDTGTATDRPDLQLWDSAFLLRVFLEGAGAGTLSPAMMIPAGSDLAKARFPVLSIDKAETSVGTPVTMVQALFPLMLKALDPGSEGHQRKVVLHVLVDGSDYARPFMIEKLRTLSRTLAEQPAMLGEEVHFTRQVLFESGAVRNDGEVSASGLRSEWTPPKETTTKAGLTTALSSALQDLAKGIDPADPATHLMLILAGPGLSDDAGALKGASAVGSSLAERRSAGADIGGILLAQGTPEPNPANGAVLADLAGGAKTKLADFGADILHELAGLSSARTQGSTNDLSKTICADAALKGIPCVVPINSTLPPEISGALASNDHTTWVALPLWLVAESAPLDLVPRGEVASDVHGAQADIRACAAIGYVWDAANTACVAESETQGIDPLDQLASAKQELGTVTAERDDARNMLDQLQQTVDSQTSELAEAQTTAASQSDQLAQLAASEQSAQSDLLAAQGQAADLSATLDQRNAELQAANDQIAKLGQEEQQINSALNDAQTRLASLQEMSASLSKSLDEAGAAKAQIEAEAAQAEADLQTRLKASEAHSAELETSAAELSQSLDAERSAKAEIAANAAQAQADLQDRLTAIEAKSSDLQAQIEQSQTTVSTLTAARDEVSARLAKAEAALAKAEQGLQDKDAKIAELGAEVATLQASLKDSGQQLSDLGNTLEDERQNAQKAQAKSAAEMDRLNNELADLTKTSDVNATLLAQSNEAKASLAALQAEKDTLSKANAATTEKLAAVAVATQKTDAKLGELGKALAAAHQDLEAVKSQDAAQIAALQMQVKDLTKARGDLSDQLAQLAAEKDKQIASLQTERDAFAKQLSDLKSGTVAAPQVAKQPTATSDAASTDQAPLFATDATPHPKSRPTGLLAMDSDGAAPAAQEAPGTSLAVLKPTTKANPDVPSRQVAPSLKAPGLNGCKFEWTGQAGRLICP